MTAGPTAPATLPPADLAGLEPAWSRLVTADDADGRPRTWHVLDSAAGGTPTTSTAPGTLLCVHGNPTWSYLWREIVAARPAGWRVIAVDQLGMGYSERTGSARRLVQRIADLSGLTAALGLSGPVVPVAHDWGGPIALGWALAHRERVAGLALTNTAVHQPAGAPAPALIRAVRLPGVLEQVCVRTATFVRGTVALARPALPAAVAAGYHAPYASADRRHAIGAFVRDIPLDAGHPSAGTLDAVADGLDALHDVPVLLLWGAADPVFSDRYLHDLEARLPHARVQRTAAAGHLVVEDTDVADTLAGWLAREVDPDRAVPPRPARDRAPLWAPLEDPALADRPALVEVASRGGRASDGDPAPGTDGTGSDRRVVSFGELGADTAALAAGLEAHGVRPGDRVALLLTPGIELATTLYACWRLGALPVLADAGLGARGLTRALRSAAPDHLVGIERALLAARALRWPGRRIASAAAPAAVRRLTGAEVGLEQLRARGARLPSPPPPGDERDAAIAFTSGATGPPKGVVYRHRQLQAQRDALASTYAITGEDRLVAAFAPFALYGPALGIPSVVPDMDVTAPRTLSARALGDAAAAIGATLVFASPAALTNVAATADEVDRTGGDALASVRLLLSAGAPVPATLLRSLAGLLPAAEPHTPYGMTEALPVADVSLAGIEAAGSGDGVCVGRPVAGVEVALSPLDASGAAVGERTDQPGVTGEVLVRADHVKDRYDRLAAVEQRSSRDLGWHRSGDVGHLDVDGRLWIEGRLVHVITTAAGVITPVALEQRIGQLPHLALAAAVGVGPPGTQQVVVVAQTSPRPPRAGLAPASLTRRVRAAVDVPVAAVLVAPELPVDVRHNSKIDRARLAVWAGRLLAGDRVGAP